MSKSWKTPSNGIWGKGKGSDRRKEISRMEEKRTRQEIQRITRRTGERVESFMD